MVKGVAYDGLSFPGAHVFPYAGCPVPDVGINYLV